MSHQVEQMAYRGEEPWHGLGNRLDPDQPIEVWTRQAGMDWDIEEADVAFITGADNEPGELRDFPQHKVLYRSDNREPLSVVSQRYKVVQPRQILEFYRDLTEVSDFELETAGVLLGGRKLWALARTGQQGLLAGKDWTMGYVLLATACDGSMATTAQFTSVRVVCNNTLAVATEGPTPGAVKVPHNTVFDAQTVKRKLGISVSAWDEFMYRLRHLAERKVSTREAQEYFLRVFTDPEKDPEGKTNQRAMARAQQLYEGAGRGAALASSRGTAFGLVNAVTEFVDHERRARTTDYRLDSAWFGQGASLKQRALEEAARMAA